MSKTAAIPNQPTDEADAPDPEFVRRKIIHTLTIFPALSASQLQVGIGPYINTRAWRPELKELLKTGEIESDEVSLEAPDGRVRTYTRYFLKGFKPPVLDSDL